MVLVDSSAWVEFLRKGGDVPTGRRVADLLDSDQAALSGTIEMEILQGLRDRDARRVQTLLSVVHFVDTLRSDYQAAGARLRELRATGVTVPASDALIASVAVRTRLPLLTVDQHFRHFTALRLA